ncbi:integrin alpha [Oscillatoria sp. CS-180]|nr:integrin alpha [Oscillatoria sp. CS-180]
MAQVEVNLEDLNGSNGFGFTGVTRQELVGTAVSILADINGDGIDDVAFGAPASVGSSADPSVQIVFGQNGSVPSALLPSNTDLGTDRLTITGGSGSIKLGFSVSSAGDINGDGINDLILGDIAANPAGGFNPSGQSFVVFGRPGNQPFLRVLNVETLDGSTGFALDGAEGDRSGSSVSGAGDVNGDGIDDYLVGAPDNNRVYLLYGQAGIQPSRINLAQLTPAQGVVLSGVTDDFAGTTVRNLGDFNGDGFDDFAIAAPDARIQVPIGGSDPASIVLGGRVYVVYGGANLPSQFDLTTLNGSNGFVFEANNLANSSRVGSSLDGAGDFNNDGLMDLIIGARNADFEDRSGVGQAYIVFGQSGSMPVRLTRDDLNGSNGLVISGETGREGLNFSADAAGSAVSGIGDFNQDGIDDVAIVSPRGDAGDKADVGRTYVVYGRAGNTTASLDLRNLAAADGLVFNGFDEFDGDGLGISPLIDGASGRVDGGGDVNGDGVPDIVIGNPAAELLGFVSASAGVAYVVFGSSDGVPSAVPGPNPLVDIPVDTVFDYQQFLRYQNPDAVIPTDEVDSLPLTKFFDETLYRLQYPDVAIAISGGFFSSGYQHFIEFGLLEGRHPSLLYSEVFYLENNPDVIQGIIDGGIISGLQHFLTVGHTEGRNPSSDFNQADYLINNPDVAAAIEAGAFQSAFEHYIERGTLENRLSAPLLYDEVFYLQNNPDVAAAVGGGFISDGFEHFVQFGQNEGRPPSSLYNEASYLALNPDVDAAVQAGLFTNGFQHYVSQGRFEERVTV